MDLPPDRAARGAEEFTATAPLEMSSWEKKNKTKTGRLLFFSSFCQQCTGPMVVAPAAGRHCAVVSVV